MKVRNGEDRRPALQRLRVLAKGGLLEVHRGARQQAVVDFMFAAEAVSHCPASCTRRGPEAVGHISLLQVRCAAIASIQIDRGDK